MKSLKHILFITALLGGLALTGCEKGPAEDAGENIDDAVENTGEALEDAGDKVKDAVDQ